MTPLELPLELVFFDAEGTGASSPLPPRWHPGWIIDEAEAVRRSTLGKQVVVFGHGSGGYLALAYALEHATAVASLILVNPFASYKRANDVSGSRLAAHPRWASFQEKVSEIKRVRLPEEEQYRAIFKEQRVLDMFQYGSHYFEMAQAADISSFNPNMHDEAELDLLGELGSIEAPTLIISGVHDPLCPIEESRAIAAVMPYVRLFEMPRSGHFPFVEERRAFGQAISRLRARRRLDRESFEPANLGCVLRAVRRPGRSLRAIIQRNRPTGGWFLCFRGRFACDAPRFSCGSRRLSPGDNKTRRP